MLGNASRARRNQRLVWPPRMALAVPASGPQAFTSAPRARTGQRHAFLPGGVAWGSGGVGLARVFGLVGHIGAAAGHDFGGNPLHRPQDRVMRDLAEVEGIVQPGKLLEEGPRAVRLCQTAWGEP
jgi:hypothetical protein